MSEDRFQELIVPEVFSRIGAQALTGSLIFSHGDVCKEVTLDHGLVVWAKTSRTDERLGQFLLSRGIITYQQYRTSLTRLEEGRKLGAILVDGADSRQLNPADLRRNIGNVPQDTLLFYGTVKENIRLGMPHADDHAVLAAAGISGVTDFVNRHPSGFDMPVGERGEGLSGGQRQSIAVARALLRDPPVILMDEPSNAMDNTTEELFKTRFGEWLGDKTLILVTHRASLLSMVDRVIVLDAGRILADGPKERVLDALKQGQIRVSKP